MCDSSATIVPPCLLLPICGSMPNSTSHAIALLQVKKQYELMRREVTMLAKQHQRDVRALDHRFRQKVAGLAARFQALEEEEAKVEVRLLGRLLKEKRATHVLLPSI